MAWIRLNHILTSSTPLYGDGSIAISRIRDMHSGDTSNNSALAFPAHSGTHVDAPSHFDPAGVSLDRLPTGYWQVARPFLIDVPCRPGDIIRLAAVRSLLESVPVDCDFLLLRTGAEQWRTDRCDDYRMRGPGIAADVAVWLRRHRATRFLGVDCISISSFAHRAEGREAHRAFLGPLAGASPPILLIEDMALQGLDGPPEAVQLAPLLFENADGAPVSVIALVGDNKDVRSLGHG